MSVFISYSTKDSEFVDQLSIALVKNRINIWLDKWSMQPGDSLIDKIQAGISDSSFLLVVLSKNSTESEWCKKEINSGLMRELDEKKVVVIPILKESCNIPLFLKEKVYADFTTDFSDGLNSLIKPLSHLISEHMGRMKDDDTITDFATNWGLDTLDEKFFFHIDVATWYQKEKKTVLLQIHIKGNDEATERFKTQFKANMDSLMIDTLIQSMLVMPETRDLNILVEGDRIRPHYIKFKDSKSTLEFQIVIRAVLMGIDTGNDVVINLIDFLELLQDTRKKEITGGNNSYIS